jgi:hypothetical protein
VLKVALTAYTGRVMYLRGLVAGAPRLDLERQSGRRGDRQGRRICCGQARQDPGIAGGRGCGGQGRGAVTGCAALSEHRLSIQFVNDVVDAIAGCIAAGDDLVINHHSSRRRLAAKFLATRGHVEIVHCDLLRPIGARDGELFG